jgi:mannosyltransferase OCH1-like enzyme
MNNPTILQFWDSDTPEYITKLLKTVQTNNEDFGYALFNDVDAQAYIREHYGQDNLTVYESCALPSMRADLFRYYYLLREGGLYVDADFRCTRSLRPLVEKGVAGCLYENKLGITNSMIFVRESNNPLLARVLDDAISNIKTRDSNSVWSVTGPGIFRRLYTNTAHSALFEAFSIIDDNDFFTYFDKVPGLEYKRTDKHWTVARDKGISIFTE